MTCFTDNCTAPGTVPVQVSASNNRGDDTEPVTVMMCRECAAPYSAADLIAFGLMGDVQS